MTVIGVGRTCLAQGTGCRRIVISRSNQDYLHNLVDKSRFGW